MGQAGKGRVAANRYGGMVVVVEAGSRQAYVLGSTYTVHRREGSVTVVAVAGIYGSVQ